MRTLLTSFAAIRRRISAAAAGSLACLLLAGGPALAEGHGHDHGQAGPRGGGESWRGGRGGGWQGGGEAGWRGGGQGGGRAEGWRGEEGGAWRGGGRVGGRWTYRSPPAYPAPRGYPGPAYPGPRGYPPPNSFGPPALGGIPVSPHPGYSLRRGGLIPPQYRGAVVPDYGRHRLRPPPPGFAWVRMGDRYMLVSSTTGQIFDVIGR